MYLSIYKNCHYQSIRYFGEQRVDFIVLETGIGGRYDSTNFLDSPLPIPTVCIITSISLDHQNMLGNTIEEIAWQKAGIFTYILIITYYYFCVIGIIKTNGIVVISGSQPPSVLDVVRKECTLRNATLILADELAPASSTASDTSTSNSTCHPPPVYPIQSQNIGMAMSALKVVVEKKAVQDDSDVSRKKMLYDKTSHLVAGDIFKSFYWPCRYCRL